MLSCLMLKIDRFSDAVLNIATLCNDNAKLTNVLPKLPKLPNQTCAHSLLEWQKDVLMLEFVLYDS